MIRQDMVYGTRKTVDGSIANRPPFFCALEGDTFKISPSLKA